MRIFAAWCLWIIASTSIAAAVSKQHTVTFGKWTTVKWLADADEKTSVDMRIRPLLVDGHTKEFTVGSFHDLTDRVFVVQRAYRLNDSLPQENGPSRWRWERGGWLLVDRLSGRLREITLAAFDSSSEVAWFRDYAAYCGVSEDEKTVYAVVTQVGKRKPLLKKAVAAADLSEKTCPTPAWLRAPARVTFDIAGEQKFTFTVRSHAVDLVVEDDEEGGD